MQCTNHGLVGKILCKPDSELFFLLFLLLYFFRTCSVCYYIWLKMSEGLHLETKGTRPLHSKSEEFNFKNSCLYRNTNFTRITFEPLFIITSTFKIKEDRSSNKPTNIPIKQWHYKGKLYRKHKGNTQTQQTKKLTPSRQQ